MHVEGFCIPCLCCLCCFSFATAWDTANKGCSSEIPLVAFACAISSVSAPVLSTKLFPCNLKESHGSNCIKIGCCGLRHSFLEHTAICLHLLVPSPAATLPSSACFFFLLFPSIKMPCAISSAVTLGSEVLSQQSLKL